ncbi:phosphatase PAP2 family protein [Clostridium acetobutylicum]|nr:MULTISPECIES: phosphatase PAP2 family protein [Clostridium]
MIFCSYLGNGGVIWLLICTFLIAYKPYRIVGISVLLSLVISLIVGEGIIKHCVKRLRPFRTNSNINILITKPLSYSFPSGHTFSSFAAANMLYLYFNGFAIIFFILASLIAISRIYLCVHYTTDIIAGFVLGLLCSKLLFILINYVSIYYCS